MEALTVRNLVAEEEIAGFMEDLKKGATAYAEHLAGAGVTEAHKDALIATLTEDAVMDIEVNIITAVFGKVGDAINEAIHVRIVVPFIEGGGFGDVTVKDLNTYLEGLEEG